MQEIVEGLTRPISEEDTQQLSFDRSTPRLLEPDSEENLNGCSWTTTGPTGCPSCCRLKRRVAEMLAGTHHRPDEVVGQMRPTSTREAWEYTVEKVAVNAVMAGARPEYFPVILALAVHLRHARVAARPVRRRPWLVVNGPIRHEIGMNWGIGAMGPYNHANATIGRAYGLLSQNLQGGSVPGVTYLGSQGNNYAYNSITFAENEERSPWDAVPRPAWLQREESTVSVFTGCRATAFTLGLREKYWRSMSATCCAAWTRTFNLPSMLDPITARQFVERGGFDTKEKLIQWVTITRRCRPACTGTISLSRTTSTRVP